MINLSIVIVNWNVCDLLRTALATIYQYPPKYSFEVFVTDNASSDGSVAMVKKEFPQVKLLASAKNLGFAAGNNLAMKQANGRVVLCLNPDTAMHPGTLDFIVEQFDKDPQLGALGVKLLNADGSLQASCKSFPGIDTILWNALSLDVLFPKSKLFGKYNMTWFAHDQELEVDQPMGAGLALRQTTLDQVGLYDERYFMYFDEVDLCYRIKQANWKIKFFPQVSITHHWAKSTSQALFSMNKSWYRSFVKYISKQQHIPLWLSWIIVTSQVWLKLLVVLIIFVGIAYLGSRVG